MNYFNSISGNRSSSRLIAFIVIMVALLDCNLVLYLGKDNVLNSAIAAGTLFITMGGPAMAFLFVQKRNETNQTK